MWWTYRKVTPPVTYPTLGGADDIYLARPEPGYILDGGRRYLFHLALPPTGRRYAGGDLDSPYPLFTYPVMRYGSPPTVSQQFWFLLER